MSKSIKFKNNTYLDSKGIVHNKELLSDKLNKMPHFYGLSKPQTTYRISMATYYGSLMFGLYGGNHFASYVGFSASGISIQHLGTGTPNLQFKFVSNGVWDLYVPQNSDFVIISSNRLSVSELS